MKIKTIINKLINIGINSKMSTEQKGLLKLSNSITWSLLTFCSLAFAIGLIIKEYITATFNLIFVVSLIIPIILNYIKKPTLAKLTLLLFSIIWIILGMKIFGYASIFKYAMIIPISISYMFFAKDKKWKLYLPIAVILLSLLFFEADKFINHNYIDNNFNNGFSEEHITGHIFESFTFFVIIIICILIQSYFQSILKKKDKELMVYKKIFDNSHEALSIMDTKGKYLKKNNAHTEILGFNDNELIGKTPGLHMDEKQYKEIIEILNRTGTYTGEFISNTKFGEKYIDLIAFTINENNNPQCIVGIQRDITKQKRLKTALENSEKKYRTLVNLMGEGLGIMDLDDKFIFANPQMEKIFEVEQGTLVNKNLKSFLDLESVNIKQSINNKENGISTYIVSVNKDNDYVKYVQVTAAPFVDNNKRKGTIAVVVDITEREMNLKALKESEEELKNANATKDKFFSIIGHDLRSPFNALIGFSNLMITNDITLEKMKKYAKHINETSLSTFQLLDSLLDWAHLQTNNIISDMQNTDLSELVNNLYLNMKNQAIEKNIELINQIGPDICVDVDKNMIETVIRNLISNAIKYCNSGDQISIKLEKENNNALISIKDTGVGIKEEIMSSLFKIGNNISTKGTNNEKGTGLGLILCKEFVEKHGGNIWVESEVGVGSVFKFTLPRKNQLG